MSVREREREKERVCGGRKNARRGWGEEAKRSACEHRTARRRCIALVSDHIASRRAASRRVTSSHNLSRFFLARRRPAGSRHRHRRGSWFAVSCRRVCRPSVYNARSLSSIHVVRHISRRTRYETTAGTAVVHATCCFLAARSSTRLTRSRAERRPSDVRHPTCWRPT